MQTMCTEGIYVYRTLDKERGMLLSAGVCMRVPFSRVAIKKPVEPLEPTDMVDFAGVSNSATDVYVSYLLVRFYKVNMMKQDS